MRKAYKYRLLGSKDSFSKADNWINLCHTLYNIALEQRIAIYKQGKYSISCFEQQKELHEFKIAYPEYKNIDSQVLKEALERLDRAYSMFYLGIKRGYKHGYPRFKSLSRYDSFTLKTQGWILSGNRLNIKKLGIFKIRLSRPIQGEIKRVTIQKKTNKWYVCFSCNNVPNCRQPKTDKSVGIDVGIKSFLVDSDNNKIDAPKYFSKSEKLLRRRQRKLARCKRGSNRRQRVKLLVAKAHDKVKNQRNDFLHKTSNHYIKTYGFIAIEDLNIKGMVRNHNLAKSISDSSWGKFFELLNYKAEEAGRIVVKVPRFEPTSKTCSSCGAIKQDLTLNDRQWVCQSCGTLHDRDFNAAKNILRVGQTLQSLTCADTQSVDCESLKSECQMVGVK